MSTKIKIVFVTTVGLHRASGNWRQSWQRVSYYMCVHILVLSVSFDHHTWHALQMHEETDTHPWFVLIGNTSTRTLVPTTQSKDGQVCISCYESTSDKSLRYNLNWSTCNNNKNNMLVFSGLTHYHFIFNELQYFYCSD